MKICKAHFRESNSYCGLFRCPCLGEKCRYYKVQTNADRIRAMSDKELARLLFKFCCNSETCSLCPLYERDCAEDEHLPTWENWLQQPVKEE